jgi:hypothetical protein
MFAHLNALKTERRVVGFEILTAMVMKSPYLLGYNAV